MPPIVNRVKDVLDSLCDGPKNTSEIAKDIGVRWHAANDAVNVLRNISERLCNRVVVTQSDSNANVHSLINMKPFVRSSNEIEFQTLYSMMEDLNHASQILNEIAYGHGIAAKRYVDKVAAEIGIAIGLGEYGPTSDKMLLLRICDLIDEAIDSGKAGDIDELLVNLELYLTGKHNEFESDWGIQVRDELVRWLRVQKRLNELDRAENIKDMLIGLRKSIKRAVDRCNKDVEG